MATVTRTQMEKLRELKEQGWEVVDSPGAAGGATLMTHAGKKYRVLTDGSVEEVKED